MFLLVSTQLENYFKNYKLCNAVKYISTYLHVFNIYVCKPLLIQPKDQQLYSLFFPNVMMHIGMSRTNQSKSTIKPESSQALLQNQQFSISPYSLLLMRCLVNIKSLSVTPCNNFIASSPRRVCSPKAGNQCFKAYFIQQKFTSFRIIRTLLIIHKTLSFIS